MMERILLDKNNSKIFEFSFVIFFIFNIFNVFSQFIIGFPPSLLLVVNIIRLLLILVFAICIFRILTINFNIKMFILFFVVLICFLLSFLVYSPIPSRIYSYISTFFTLCLPLGLFAFYVDSELLIKKMSLLAICSSIVYFFIAIIIIFNRVTIEGYDTSISYCMLLPFSCLMSRINLMKKKMKILSIISMMIYIIFTFMFGSRGPLIILFFIGIYLIFYRISCGNTKSVVLFIILILTCLLIVLFSNEILTIIVNIFGKIGIDSRTINILKTEGYHDSGRSEIYQLIFDKIIDSPFSFRGIASDTLIIIDSQYTHNLFLEITYEFGIVIGILFLIIVFISIINSLKFKSYRKNQLCTIVCILCVTQLMISSSVWLNYTFWIWIVLLIKKSDGVNDEK